MPFLLADDAAEETKRRLQEYGTSLLQPLQDASSGAQQLIGNLGQPLQDITAQVQPPVQAVQGGLQRLQDFGSQALNSSLQALPQIQPLQQPQAQPGALQRLQDFGQQTLDTALKPLQQAPQAVQQGFNAFNAFGTQDQQQQGGDLQSYARQAAQKAGIDPDIFVRQIQQESGFNPTARSSAGAQGIAQFMPDTAKGVGLDPSDPYASLDAAARMDAQNLQKYGGDWGKALAAYNAGGGNVDKYGGIPPFEETQRYVNTILQGAQNVVQQGVQAAQGAVQGAKTAVTQAASNVLPAISQFGDKQLTAAEAYAACGPAAAVRFATMFGRQPTLREATDLAAQVGWTPDGGMAGLGSESALFDKLNIPHRQVGADWTALAREAQSGNPVTISTPGHYFTADSYDPNSGAFHVGSSGTDLRGGSEWMTPAQMEARMGKLQGGLAVDNPQVPGPSPLASGAVQAAQGGLNAVGQAKDRAVQALQDITSYTSPVTNAIGGAFDQAGRTLSGTQPPREWTPEERARLAAAVPEGGQFEPIGLESLIPGGGGPGLPGIGALTRGDVLEQQINDWVAQHNPLREEPVLGPASTFVGQQVLNPTNWALMGGGLRPGAALGDLLTDPEVQAVLRTRQLAQGINPFNPPRLSAADLADTLRQYPEDVQNGLRNFVSTQTEAGASGKEINDTLRQWVADNPLRPEPPSSPLRATTQDLPAPAAGKSAQLSNGVARVGDDVVLSGREAGIGGSTFAKVTDMTADGSGLMVTLDDGSMTVVRSADARLVVPSGEVQEIRPGTGTPYTEPPLQLEPEIAATLRPGTGPLAPPVPEQPATDVLTGLENMARGRGMPPLETLTGAAPPPPPSAPTAGPVRAAPTQPGPLGRLLGAPGEAFSRFGSLIASALGPVENLPVETAGVLKNYANMVGRQSDAARVMAENRLRTAGARLDIPAVQEQVSQLRYELRDEAARKMVAELQAQGKAAPIRNAPREFRTVTDNPNTYLANYAFSPELVAPIKAVTDMSDIAANPLGGAILRGIGTAKGTLFSLSNFHTLTEALNAMFTSPQTLKNYGRALVSDSFAQGLRGSMADTFDAAAQAGVTGLAEHARPEDVGTQLGDALWRRVVAGGVSGVGGAAAGYTETKLTGGTDEEAWANAAKGGVAGLALAGLPIGRRGTVPEILQSALWDRAVPLAKATAWDALTRGGLDAQAAAQVVNERFGGLNYAAMGRSPTLLDAQRLTLMASDWNEATVRQLASAIFGGSGQGVRVGFLAKTIGGMMTATEVLNYALSGHSTLENEPGHQFEVEVPNPNGGTLHFGILPGNVQAYLNLANTEVSDPKKRGTQPVNFIVNRLSAPVGTGIDAALTAAGKPPFQVARAGPIAYGENVAPIGVSQVLQSVLQGGLNPLVGAGLAAAGLNPRYSATGGGGFTAPGTRAPLPTRTSETSSGARAPVPKR